MTNGKFKRDSLGTEEKYNWFKHNCPLRVDKCDPIPYGDAIGSCAGGGASSAPWYEKIVDNLKKAIQAAKCKPSAQKAFREYCKEAKNKIPSCYQYYPTKATVTTTTATNTVKATTSTKTLPFIIGGIVGVIVLLAIVIGIFCYCKKKKASGKGQSMTGTTIGGSTATGTTTKTGTKTNTGTTKTGTTTGAPTARY
ncbi:hypothetical protein B9Z55_027162 [Caenorhabditis nigoni]|uniref:Uncharacterized protein n=1 Tax=Caenorhabditis nigoni TaxID=1611254 RepID=A0A2G5SGX0_9PELO|nr:hypothetical protein B9Z55_027162 [Caenorhabditis nigoni]